MLLHNVSPAAPAGESAEESSFYPDITAGEKQMCNSGEH